MKPKHVSDSGLELSFSIYWHFCFFVDSSTLQYKNKQNLRKSLIIANFVLKASEYWTIWPIKVRLLNFIIATTNQVKIGVLKIFAYNWIRLYHGKPTKIVIQVEDEMQYIVHYEFLQNIIEVDRIMRGRSRKLQTASN